MTTDEIPWVVLGEQNKTAKITSFVDTVPEGTVAIVGGSGKDANRLQTEVGDTTLTGIKRREIFVDASDCGDTDSMTARGNEALEDAKSTTIEMELVAQDYYGRDFTLGDIVSVDMGVYGAYALRVAEVETEYSAESKHINLTLGAELKGVIRVIRDAVYGIPTRRQ